MIKKRENLILNKTRLFLLVSSVFSYLFSISLLVAAESETVSVDEAIANHQLEVEYDPLSHFVSVHDVIHLPKKLMGEPLEFKLHSGLKITSHGDGYQVQRVEENVDSVDKGMDQEKFDGAAPVTLSLYRVTFDSPAAGKDGIILELEYQGKIYHPIQQQGEEYSRGFSQSPGIIETRGVYLAGSTYWIPSFADEYITYDLKISSPKGWRVVSQGKRERSDDIGQRHIDVWAVDTPTEEIYVIGAKFNEYSFDVGAVKAMAFLRSDDEGLANKYLETTAQYMEMYRNLIGPYPYSKFALVENFWETGYGMPSFTLLGEQIIRFPFILHSSYPHELLHNWWGNSVYIDFDQGNWCEGLTAYMADHLIAEQRGTGAEYRRSTLQAFTDYVDEKSDFSLNKFIARDSPASSAIGYGKSAMMWDMLREKVGDANFIKSFQRFYRNNKFKRVSYQQIRQAFESSTGKTLGDFFKQWTQRKGAPELELNNVKVSGSNSDFKLEFTLNQVQLSDAFEMDIPIAVYSEKTVTQHQVKMDSKQQNYSLTLKEKPLKIQVDPQFNLFRKLHFSEIPPSLSKAFGAEKVTIILPSQASAEEKKRYEKLAAIWAKQSEKFEVVIDSAINSLPKDRAVWIFGWNNRFKNIVEKGVAPYGTKIGANEIIFGKTILSNKDNSIVVSSRHPKNNDLVMVWVTVNDDAAVAGLARKLPHYGKYSYLGFTGNEPTNVVKGQWPTVNSPLVVNLIENYDSINVKLPKRSALAKLAPVFSTDRLKKTIEYLASDTLKGRGLGTTELDQAADYIAEQFKLSGLLPAGDEQGYFQEFVVSAGKDKKRVVTRNIVGVIAGSEQDWAEESVVISAHYDHLGLGWPDVAKGNEGKIHNGADDNASGVAVLLELAQTLKSMKPKRNIIFAAFSGEEAGLLGSKYYVKNITKYPVRKIMGVVNMDTIGRLGENKIMVLGGSSAKEWKFIFMGTGFVTGIESEMVSQEINSSDQVSFVDVGIPAIQLFAGTSPNYHKPTDTADKIDYSGLVKVATVAREVVNYLSERDEPLTFKGKKADARGVKNRRQKQARRVSTGIMPDFTFNGKGVQVSAVGVGSPAGKSGVKKGDIITELSGTSVDDLRDYSDELKKHKVGEEIILRIKRDKEILVLHLTLIAR